MNCLQAALDRTSEEDIPKGWAMFSHQNFQKRFWSAAACVAYRTAYKNGACVLH